MRLGAVAVGLGASLLVGSGASATPPDPGVRGTIIWQRTMAGRELTYRVMRIPAGADTGWHYHDGPLYVRVRRGTLTHFDSRCVRDGVYSAGASLQEPGGKGHVHLGRNLGRTEVVLEVLYVLPIGSPLSEDAPRPRCAGQEVKSTQDMKSTQEVKSTSAVVTVAAVRPGAVVNSQ